MKKLLGVFIACAFLALSVFGLVSCGTDEVQSVIDANKTKLSTPTNIRVDENYILRWDNVESADSYTVTISYSDYTTSIPSIDLKSILSVSGEYEIYIRAKSEQIYIESSNLSEVFILDFRYENHKENESASESGGDEPSGYISGEWEITKAPTCKEEGEERRVAIVDGEEIIETRPIEKLTTHTESEWIIDSEPTCTENGSKHKECSVCGTTIQTENINKLGHNEVQHAGQAATCTEVGWNAYITCTRCNYTTYSGISALGHNYVGGVCTRCGAQENISGATYTREGDYIYFGSYPQSKVTDSSITSVLNGVAGTLPTNGDNRDWTSYGYYKGTGIRGSQSNSEDYMWYIDITYSGSKYRGVYFTSYRPYSTSDSSSTSNTYQDDNGYYTSNVYWFKFEPIKWRILEEDGTYATILSEIAIDSQGYNYTVNSRTIDGKTVYGNNYEYSSIRQWLNDTFYNTAFSSLQKAIIQTVTVDNSARSTNPDNNATQWNSGNNTYACNNTEDKVWLLSEQEVTKAAYGFNASYSASDTARQARPSDYAKAQGCHTATGTYAGCCWWWLRSPNYGNNGDAFGVSSVGNAGNSNVDITDFGILPALKIAL